MKDSHNGLGCVGCVRDWRGRTPYQRLAPRPLLDRCRVGSRSGPAMPSLLPVPVRRRGGRGPGPGEGAWGPHLWMLAFGLGECCAVFFYKTYQNRVIPASYAEKVLEFKLSVRSF